MIDDERVERVLAGLRAEELVAPADELRAREVVAAALTRPGSPAGPGEALPRLAEVVAYLGAALVLAAGALFLGLHWSDLGAVGQVACLAAVSVVLLGAGLVVLRGAARRLSSSRRRLAAVLLDGAVVAAGSAVGRWVHQVVDRSADVYWPGLAGAVVAGLGALWVQRYAATALGLAVMLLSVLSGVLFVALGGDHAGEVVAVAFWVVGGLWLLLAEGGVLGDRQAARPMGILTALLGGQIGVLTPYAELGYLLTALVAAGGLVGYLLRPAWPHLAGAVAAVTLVVPEAVADWTDGGLGVVGGVLVAGVTLLVASLGALRLRREAAA